MTDSTPPVEAVLVYDGECPQCAHASGALQSLPRLAPISWHDAEAQQALEAQFGDVPAATTLFDRSTGQVYAGRTAVAELGARAETGAVADRFVGSEHAHGEGEIGAATDGRPSAGVAATDPAGVDGIHSLSPAARARLPALIAAASAEE